VSIWDAYDHRVSANGSTRREKAYNREVRMINQKIRHNLSYHQATFDDVEQNVIVINSDNLNEKTVFAMPGEDIALGTLMYWMNNYWLVVERDANTEIQTRVKVQQCNYLLKWIDSDTQEICEQWCIIEDGTKYLTGEYEDRNFVVTRGDSRIAMTIGKNDKTIKFDREDRFLIDDPDSDKMLAYILSKPLKSGNIYEGNGIYKFVLQEVVSTYDDNQELGIADYYKYYPKDDEDDEDSDSTTDSADETTSETTSTSSGKEVWL